jgi:hypothetical protein
MSDFSGPTYSDGWAEAWWASRYGIEYANRHLYPETASYPRSYGGMISFPAPWENYYSYSSDLSDYLDDQARIQDDIEREYWEMQNELGDLAYNNSY